MDTDTRDETVLAPLFAALPLHEAMPSLLPTGPAGPAAMAAARALATGALRQDPAAQAALWLYVDDLEASHALSQGLHDATGSYLHGIMHRREGDFSNSHYWIRRAGSHPVWREIPGYDPRAFIDAVAAARGADPEKLLALQRAEWRAVMQHCLRAAGA